MNDNLSRKSLRLVEIRGQHQNRCCVQAHGALTAPEAADDQTVAQSAQVTITLYTQIHGQVSASRKILCPANSRVMARTTAKQRKQKWDEENVAHVESVRMSTLGLTDEG